MDEQHNMRTFMECYLQSSESNDPIITRVQLQRFDHSASSLHLPSWPTHPEACFFAPEVIIFQCVPSKSPRLLESLAAPPTVSKFTQFYPSPPDTGSPLKNPVPLPVCDEHADFFTGAVHVECAGMLDSPSIMRNEDFAFHTPLSPPPTLPTITLDLPQMEDDTLSNCEDESLSPLDTETLVEPCNDNVSDTLAAPAPPVQQLLSPISPTWGPRRVSDPPSELVESALLSEFSPSSEQKTPFSHQSHAWEPSYDDTGLDSDLRSGCASNALWSLQSPTGMDMKLPGDTLEHFPSLNPGDSEHTDHGHGGLAMEISPEPSHKHLGRDDREIGSPPRVDWMPWGSEDDLSVPFVSPSDAQAVKPSQRVLNSLNVSTSYLDSSANYSTCNVEFGLPPYSSNTRDAISSLPDLESDTSSQDINNNIPHFVEHSIPTPSSSLSFGLTSPFSSPLVRKRSLELDDDDEFELARSPSSPSRRSFTSLPDMDDSFLPSSPSQIILALPGADTDDDLLPPPPSSFIPSEEALFSPTPLSAGQTLLFLDDPNDVPLPRSPSPEDFDLDIGDCEDPELKKLYDLRKRSIVAERAARYTEVQLIEAGNLNTRAEVRRIRKKEKERSKEIGALLRLKLSSGRENDDNEDAPQLPQGKGAISSISQLVARMVFRRHETVRPLGNPRTSSTTDSTRTQPNYIRSSLSREPIVAEL